MKNQKNNSNVYIVIPAFNEMQKVGKVVLSLAQRGYSVVVVDDGSTDDTFEKAKEAGADSYKHLINVGQGASLQTGIDIALNKGAEVIVTYDADEQFDPDDINALLEKIKTQNTDVVLGSRFLKKQNIPFTRKLLLKFATIFTRVTTGLSVSDTHNGLRAFTRESAKKISITQPRMAHASEILSEIAELKLRIVEVPVTVRYTEYSLGKGQKSSAGIRILFDLLFRR
jgi:glycosyltransferase involved in cell wall biosynthesis